jgi:hypothetical protein
MIEQQVLSFIRTYPAIVVEYTDPGKLGLALAEFLDGKEEKLIDLLNTTIGQLAEGDDDYR